MPRQTSAIARKVRFTPRAAADRDAIFDYLREHSIVGARNVLASIGRAIELLRDQPYAGSETEVEGVRMVGVRRYPYRIFYRVERGAVELIHIRHSARQKSEFE